MTIILGQRNYINKDNHFGTEGVAITFIILRLLMDYTIENVLVHSGEDTTCNDRVEVIQIKMQLCIRLA
jgi:hypothetical protein